jgi:hypothetical protein
VTAFGEPRGQRNGLDGRAADIQARDHAKNAHPEAARPLYHFNAERLTA